MGAADGGVGTGAAVVIAVVIVGEAIKIGGAIAVGGAMGADAADDIILKSPIGFIIGAG